MSNKNHGDTMNNDKGPLHEQPDGLYTVEHPPIAGDGDGEQEDAAEEQPEEEAAEEETAIETA